MSSSGLRERKKVETRRSITRVALQLATERGPNCVTVEDIAAAAEVSPRTVFNYFGTKDEAILGIDPESRAEIASKLGARPADEAPLDSLHVVLRERITTVDDTGGYWRARAELVRSFPELRAAQVASQAALERELTEVIATRTDLGTDDDIYPTLVVTVALATLRSVLGWSNSSGPARLGSEIDSAFAQLGAGLQTPIGARV